MWGEKDVDEIACLLQGIGLAECAPRFRDSGFLTVETLSLLSDLDMERCGVQPGHVARVREAVREHLKGSSGESRAAHTQASWLAHALRAERLRVQIGMERRHLALVQAFQARAAAAGPSSNPWEFRGLDDPSAAEGARPSPRGATTAFAEVDCGDLQQQQQPQLTLLEQEALLQRAPKTLTPVGGEGLQPGPHGGRAGDEPPPTSSHESHDSPHRMDGSHSLRPTVVRARKKTFSKRRREQNRPVQILLDRGYDLPGWYITFSNWIRGEQGELCFLILVLLNAIFLCVQSQYMGLMLGYESSLTELDVSEEWTNVRSYEHGVEVAFGIAFTLELVLKVAASHVLWPFSAWNLIDFLVVIVWWLKEVWGGVRVNPMFGRLVRLFKVARLVRIAKSASVFDSLRLTLTSITHCVPVASWSVLLLLMVTMAGALTTTALAKSFIEDTERESEEARLQMYKYFGTFTRAWLSMFELTVANWVPIMRHVLETMGEPAAFGILCYQLVMGFSVMKVIAGVFLQETYKAVANDDELMVLRKQRDIQNFQDKMRSLFQYAGGEDNDTLRLQEFESAVDNDPLLKEWLSSLDLDVSCARLVWDIKDQSHEEGLTLQELSEGVHKIRGFARASDLLQLSESVHRLRAESSDAKLEIS